MLKTYRFIRDVAMKTGNSGYLIIFVLFVLFSSVYDIDGINGSYASDQHLSSSEEDNIVSKNDDQKSDWLPTPVYTREPMTSEYFNNFLDSTESFSDIGFVYMLGYDPEFPNEPQKWIRISIDVKTGIDENYLLNQSLQEIEVFNGIYYDGIEWKSYKCSLSQENVMPIFHFIQGNADFYFNAVEYNGEESLDYALERSFGHEDYISMSIFQPDQPAYETGTSKTFCKGWDPGDDPPEELLPLINYLEETIIPMIHDCETE